MKIQINEALLPGLDCDLTLILEPGKPVVLIGENGIGKTTLFNRVRHSFPCIHVPQRAHEIFYDRKLGTFRTLFCEHAASLLNSDRFNHFWRISGLEEKGERLLSHLSGGEAQLVKLVTQLSLNAELYLLDEPSQYLDTGNKLILRELAEDLTANVLIIEHDLSWVPAHWTISRLHQVDQCLQKDQAWTT